MVSILSIIKNAKRSSIGYIAGYMLNAAKNSPLNKKSIARCIPHPGQSKPQSCFVKQGSIKLSIVKRKKTKTVLMYLKELKREITTIFV